MLHSSKGIVINALKYGDSGFIVKIYTASHGLVPFLVQGVHGKKAAIKPSMLQPLSLVEAVYYYKTTRQIQRLKELRCRPVLQLAHTNPVRSSMALFCAEVALKVLKTEEPDDALFNTLSSKVQQLDAEDCDVPYYPLRFLLDLSVPLGFPPAMGPGTYFYLAEGVFSNITPVHGSQTLNEMRSSHLKSLLEGKPGLKSIERSQLLDDLLTYYAYHVQGFGEMKSLPIIKSILKPAAR